MPDSIMGWAGLSSFLLLVLGMVALSVGIGLCYVSGKGRLATRLMGFGVAAMMLGFIVPGVGLLFAGAESERTGMAGALLSIAVVWIATGWLVKHFRRGGK